MISGKTKKGILFSFLFLNFIYSSKSAQAQKIIEIENNLTYQPISTKLSNKKKSSIFSKLFSSNLSEFNGYKNFSNKNVHSLLADISHNQKEIVIQADKQSDINDVVYAQGNVEDTYNGKIL